MNTFEGLTNIEKCHHENENIIEVILYKKIDPNKTPLLYTPTQKLLIFIAFRHFSEPYQQFTGDNI